MTIHWWTLGIQAVNVVILIWLLGRFFWRPFATMIEQRRTAAQQILAEAETKRRQATDAMAEIERTRDGFDKERKAIIAAARETAEQARTALLASAAKDAAALKDAAMMAIEKERSAAETTWADGASRLAVEIAERLVVRLDGSVLREIFLDWLLKEIQALPDPVREGVAADGAVLEVVSATPIDPTDQQRYQTSIGKALGARPQITFREDPALIAGLDLRGPHLIISNSWRADLSRILAELAHDR